MRRLKDDTKVNLILVTIVVLGLAVMFLVAQTEQARAAECFTDGEQGVTTAWGECMTPTLYNSRFSHAELSKVETHTLPGVSVADAYNIAPDVASERLLGDGLVPLFTFRGWVLGDLTPS